MKKCSIDTIVLFVLFAYSGLAVASNIPLRPPVMQFNATMIDGAKPDNERVNSDSELSVREIHAQATFAKVDLSFGKLVFGMNYKLNQYEFNNIDAKDRNLHAFDIPISLIIPRDDWLYVGRITPGIHSDFEKMGRDDYVGMGLFQATYKRSNSVSWVMGLGFDRSFGDTQAFPIGGLRYTPNSQWLVNLVFPQLSVNYGPSARYFFFWSAQPSGGKWNIELKSLDRALNVTTKAFRSSVGSQIKLGTKIWLKLEAGIEFGRTIEVVTNNGITTEQDLENAGFATLGFAYHMD